MHKKIEDMDASAVASKSEEAKKERRPTLNWGNFHLPATINNKELDTKPPSPPKQPPVVTVGSKKVEFPTEEIKSQKSVLSAYRKW